MSNKIAAAVGFGAVVICSTWAAMAQESLGEKQKWREQEEYLAAAAAPVKAACGKDITASFDKPSFKDQMETKNSFYGFCGEAFTGLSNICATPDGKAAVAAKISKIECTFGGKDKRALSLKDGTLQMSIDWDAANYQDFLKAWLLKNL
jgi:hypothetical protein